MEKKRIREERECLSLRNSFPILRKSQQEEVKEKTEKEKCERIPEEMRTMSTHLDGSGAHRGSEMEALAARTGGSRSQQKLPARAWPPGL
ncbi:leucine-rich repeat extensin-like protein 7 [Iris pallida]|uniref:Leucine-rich repeat extensin-like protein 7 n=1 Tax=Iris pallida TaxID=29817 RepID=A0AAX6GBX6_IRIPA|nr:leucine-rich repeat extensin-like protein 7 [Iris pallida]